MLKPYISGLYITILVICIDLCDTYSSKCGNWLYRKPNASKDDINIIATIIKAFDVDNSSALDDTFNVVSETFTIDLQQKLC